MEHASLDERPGDRPNPFENTAWLNPKEYSGSLIGSGLPNMMPNMFERSDSVFQALKSSSILINMGVMARNIDDWWTVVNLKEAARVDAGVRKAMLSFLAAQRQR